MSFFLGEHEVKVANKHLKELFRKLDYADTGEQYLLLLQIAKLSFQIQEPDAFSYILQAGLICRTYEVETVSAYFTLKKGQIQDTKEHIMQLENYSSKELEVFSLEELDLFLGVKTLSESEKQLREEIKGSYNIPLNGITQYISFEDIIKDHPQQAIHIINQIKKNTGLDEKYPKLNHLSIKDWEKEFSNRKEEIEKKELLLQKNVSLELEDFMSLGKMYLLENKFEKAAECFTHAKNLFTLKPF